MFTRHNCDTRTADTQQRHSNHAVVVQHITCSKHVQYSSTQSCSFLAAVCSGFLFDCSPVRCNNQCPKALPSP